MKLKPLNPLGKTGLNIPTIIYGTSYLGNLYKELSYEQKLALMSKWFECTEKPVVIDSAGKYGAGLALEMINMGLTELGIEPEQVLISNKLGWCRVALEADHPTFEPGAWVGLKFDAKQSFGYNEIIECFNQGNYLLGEYSAQLVSVHDPDEYINCTTDNMDRSERLERILDSYTALFDLKASGKVKAVGIGAKDWKIIRELYDEVKFDWVMLANSFTIYSHPSELIDFMNTLEEDGTGIINSAVFHGGFLTGGDKFDYKDVDFNTAYGRNLRAWRTKFNRICKEYQVEPEAACIHFGISHPGITSIALNTSRPEKMNQNVNILLSSIPEDFWIRLKEEKMINSIYTYV